MEHYEYTLIKPTLKAHLLLQHCQNAILSAEKGHYEEAISELHQALDYAPHQRDQSMLKGYIQEFKRCLKETYRSQRRESPIGQKIASVATVLLFGFLSLFLLIRTPDAAKDTSRQRPSQEGAFPVSKIKGIMPSKTLPYHYHAISNQENPSQLKGVVSISGIHVRKTPTIKAQKISTLPKGTECLVLSTRVAVSEGYHWFHVQLPNQQVGWIASDFLYSLQTNQKIAPLMEVIAQKSVDHIFSGQTYHQRGQYAEAIMHYTTAITLTSTYLNVHTPTPYRYRAETYRSLGQCQRALKDFAQACQYGDKDSCSHHPCEENRLYSLLTP